MTFENTTVIIRGGGSGIGAATAHRFAADGATVFCVDVDGAAAASVAAAICDTGGRAHAIECDVTDETAIAAMTAKVMTATGRIDTVAANAGGMVEGGILELSLDDWKRSLDVNATGAFLTARATLPHLVETKGALVFTASTVALAGMKGVTAYSAAKGAIAALTRQLAADFGLNIIAQFGATFDRGQSNISAALGKACHATGAFAPDRIAFRGIDVGQFDFACELGFHRPDLLNHDCRKLCVR